MDDLRPMHNPPHPGEFISEVYLEPFGVSGRELAQQLDVSASTLSRVLNGSSRVSLGSGWACPDVPWLGLSSLSPTPKRWVAPSTTRP